MAAGRPAREASAADYRIRRLKRSDLSEVVRIHALHTGQVRRDYWEPLFRELFGRRGERLHLALAMESGQGLAGYLLGDVRAFEFGSEPCGWVFAVGVEPECMRRGVASRLLEEASRRFREAGVGRIRTMVRRNDVPMLSFFRASGFAGGPFVQLEKNVGEE